MGGTALRDETWTAYARQEKRQNLSELTKRIQFIHLKLVFLNDLLHMKCEGLEFRLIRWPLPMHPYFHLT